MILNIVGDLCLHGIIQQDFNLDKRLTAEFDRADINLANLESPLSRRMEANRNSLVNLLGAPEYGPVLKWFNVVSLANNHILDHRGKGLADTLCFLREHSISFFGIGDDLERSFEPLIIEAAGETLAFLGMTRWNNAGRNRAGTTPISLGRLSRSVRSLKTAGCFVIVYPHWNYEYVDYPAPDYRNASKRLIDAGADIVIASHPHVVHGFENYRHGMIFHSLGNFVFHQDVFSNLALIRNDPRLNLSFILQLELSGQRLISHRIIPIKTNSDSVCLMEPPEKQVFLAHLEVISRVLTDPEKYPRVFYRDAAAISLQTSRMLKKLAAEKGKLTLLKTLTRVKKQDIKIKIASLLMKPKEERT